jgi:thiol-disulfide isomerase/thioredoxin
MRCVLPFVLLACLLALPAGCNNEPKPSSDTSTPAAPAKSRFGDSPLLGKNAPEFSLPTLAGGTASNADLKGHVTIVDFWATWCEPCRRSMPHLQQLAANPELSAKGLRVLAVNATHQDDRADVEAYMKETGFTFPVPLDENGMMTQAFQVRGFPTTFVVGRDGTVRNVFVGVMPDTLKALDEAVAAALK